jgi:hypothetical protein
MTSTKNPAAWRADGVLNGVVASFSTSRSILKIAKTFKNFALALATSEPSTLVALAALVIGEARQ